MRSLYFIFLDNLSSNINDNATDIVVSITKYLQTNLQNKGQSRHANKNIYDL